jgi:hypothetical protein
MISGAAGSAWREADLETADLETVIHDLIAGEYRRPIMVVAFNTSERWSEDVSRTPRNPASLQSATARRPLAPAGIERHEGRHRQLTLRLV